MKNYLCRMEIVFALDKITDAAGELLSAIGQRKVIALHGDMGAGKTTLSHALCDVLGVSDTVSSPTFSIINEYALSGGKAIYHLDLYRLKDEEEALAAGVEDCFYSGNICLVEWPEKAPDLLPEDTVHCYLTIKGENERLLRINL